MILFEQTRSLIRTTALAAGLFAGVGGTASAAVVLSNNPTGDLFTNPTSTNTGQAVGASGWYYNNVRVDGTVGISDAYPRAGNGSVRFSTKPVAAPGTTNAKADIEFLPNATQTGTGNFVPTGSLGRFRDLTSMSYDWYRNSSSTNSGVQHPALRVLLAVPLPGGGFSTGGLVFERAYNVSGNAPTNTWVSDTVSGTSKVWKFGLSPIPSDPLGLGPYNTTLADWQGYLPQDTQIIGISAGVGSGWGFFEGAVDNIAWTISGQTASFNFEIRGNPPVPVPLPAVVWILIVGIILLAGFAHRWRTN